MSLVYAMDVSVDELTRSIDSAFSSRAYPGDANIAEEAAGDPTYEGNRVADFFRGKRWQDVTWKSILANRSLDPKGFMFILTPEAFAYYLPAFLKESLDVDSAPELAESVHFALSPYEGTDSSRRQWKEQRMSLFSEEERAVITRVYDHLSLQLD